MKLNLEALPKVGERIEVKYKTGTFTVEVLDARIRYGNIDALVRPVTGSGQFWTVYHKVTNTPESLEPYKDSAKEEIIEEVTDEELENASLVE